MPESWVRSRESNNISDSSKSVIISETACLAVVIPFRESSSGRSITLEASLKVAKPSSPFLKEKFKSFTPNPFK